VQIRAIRAALLMLGVGTARDFSTGVTGVTVR
jgi:hypothetical protein